MRRKKIVFYSTSFLAQSVDSSIFLCLQQMLNNRIISFGFLSQTNTYFHNISHIKVAEDI